jgi:hypothetical protein
MTSIDFSALTLRRWTSALSCFDLSLIRDGNRVIPSPAPSPALKEFVLALGGLSGGPGYEYFFQLLDLPFLEKNCPATPHHATMAVSISSSHAIKADDTPQAEGSSERP